jgi:putative ABC transport system permease protein
MRAFRQIATVTALNARGLFGDRFWSSFVIVVGMACVVGVLLSMLSFSTGVSRTISSAAHADRAIVVAQGARDEYGQAVTRDNAIAIQNAPGIARDRDGKAIVSPEQITNMPIRRKADDLPVRMILRGVGPNGIAIRPEFHLVGGRMFQPGTRELIAGTAAQRQFGNLDIGSKVIMPDGEWSVVGAFETNGDLIEGQLLGDIDTVLASRRQNGYGSVMVRLETPDAFDRFKAAVTSNPALKVDVERQATFYGRTAGQFTIFFAGIAYLLGGIMAVGALFGTLNVMHSAVASRTREIATLRALGFGAAPVAISVIVETLFLTVLGAFIGAAVAWALFNGNNNAIGGFVVFDLAVTFGLVMVGVTWAVVIAVLAGLVPAIRAARVPVATALRAG